MDNSGLTLYNYCIITIIIKRPAQASAADQHGWLEEKTLTNVFDWQSFNSYKKSSLSVDKSTHPFSGFAMNIYSTSIAFPNSVIMVIHFGTLRVHVLRGQNLSTTHLRSTIQQRTYRYYTTIRTAVYIEIIPDPLKEFKQKGISQLWGHADLTSFDQILGFKLVPFDSANQNSKQGHVSVSTTHSLTGQ